jgi:hypothetical protein
LVLVVLCAGLLSLFPRKTLSFGFGMASSVKKTVNTLDSHVQAQQQATAATSAILTIKGAAR